MNACPNCGAELKFDIVSQKLACPFCGAMIDPSAYTDFGAAAEEVHVSADMAAPAEEGIAQDVVPASQVIPDSVSNYAQGTGNLGPSGGAMGPSGSFASVGGAGTGFASQGSGVSGSFASQGGATPAGGGFAGQGIGTYGSSFASQGAAPVGGGFMQQGQGGAFGGSTNFAAAGSSTAAAQNMAAMGVGAAVTGMTGMAGQAPNAMPTATPFPGQAPVAGGYIPTAAPYPGTMPMQAQVYPTQQAQMNPSVEDLNFDPTANYQDLEVIAYSCPQCGGSIYSTDESVNGFCSFCGSNITLQSRMAKMKYPKFVLPFRVNKNACKQYYLNHVKKAFFAPKELKNPEYLDRFRGIYMPYWGYDVMCYGNVMLEGTRSYRRGDYVFTEHYQCTGLVDAFYKGLSFDASSSFDDYYSEQIAPYDAHARVDFNPAYLSGFYADLQDVSYHLYESDAIDFGRKQIMEGIKKSQAFPGLSFSPQQEKRINPAVDARHDGVYTAFFPVWFLSYRNNDRVAYAVVNGQTGKLISDLPVDKKKFVISAALMAIPLFFLLMSLPTMMPASTLLLGELLSVLAVMRLMRTVKKVYERDRRLDDRGYLSKRSQAEFHQAQAEIAKKKRREQGVGSVLIIGIFVSIVFVIMSPEAAFGMLEGISKAGNGGKAIIALILAVLLVVVNASGGKVVKQVAKSGAGTLMLGVWLIFAATLYGSFVILLDPVSNLPYYLGVIMLFAGTLIAQLMALEQYNNLTTRPLPQLNRKGGDDSAQD